MSALYAFCREVDDVADEETVPVETRRARLAHWREDIRCACTGGEPELAVNRELRPVIEHCRLPFEHFDDLLRGVEMDLDIKRYSSYAELEGYCYRVASVVGLLSIEIFGYREPATREYAVQLGKALQFTNILRDVQTDAARGRIYLPEEELDRFGVRPEEILEGRYSDRYRALARAFDGRARGFFRQARGSLPAVDRRAMIAAELMGAVYWRLLGALAARDFNVFRPEPVRVGKACKLYLIGRTWLRLGLGLSTPNYGFE